MTQSFLNQSPTNQDKEQLTAFSVLFSKARRFYQYKAETADAGNLRRKFAALAELHQQILYLLPTPQQNCTAAEGMEILYQLSYWYENKQSHRSVATIQQQLLKQLQLQKTLIRNFNLGLYQHSLLHFTASLQIAADQLAEIKTC